MSIVVENTIEVQTHGRYLLRPAQGGTTAGILVGFHGYAESADIQLARLDVPESQDWQVLSIQGLHRFYQRRTQEVVASWMTRQDRELALADNIAYVSKILEREVPEGRSAVPAVFAGFSQGVAMAFRAATRLPLDRRHVIAVGGDVPPELERESLAGLSSVLLCRGMADPWYTDADFQKDLNRLRDASVTVREVRFEGGHDWSADVAAATADHLRRCRLESTV